MRIIHAPVPPGAAPPVPRFPPLSGQSVQQLQGLHSGLISAGGQALTPPAAPTPAPVPVPCALCRDRGWVFVSVLDGTTKRCSCEEAF
jgi:hypothetical protein